MPTSYTICDVEEFPDKDNFFVQSQHKLTQTDSIVEDPKTSVNLHHKNYFNDFDRYNCEHEILQHKHGIANGAHFQKYREPHDFPAYYSIKQRIFIIKSSKSISNSFITTCNNKIGNFECKRLETDYEKIIPILSTISGAWFANLKTSFVKSAAYFGPHVDRSQEFKKAAEDGMISSLNVNHPFNGEEHVTAITKDGSVVLYNNYINELTELKIVLNIFNKYLNF